MRSKPLLTLAAILAVGAIALVVVGVAQGYRKAQARLPSEQFAADFSSPHGALRLYQSAWERRDIDAMVAAKDFTDEAVLMLQKLDAVSSTDTAILSQAADTLELAFRAQWRDATWPDLTGAKSLFSEPIPISENAVRINHVIVYGDGRREWAKVRVVRRDGSWRVSHAPM